MGNISVEGCGKERRRRSGWADGVARQQSRLGSRDEWIAFKAADVFLCRKGFDIEVEPLGHMAGMLLA
jgi:hypothetical protein